MIEFGSIKDIRREIRKILKLIKIEKDDTVRLMLFNYIGNLYSALSVIKDKKIYINQRKVFGNLSHFQIFIKQTDFLMDKFIENFIANQKFHQDYFNDLLINIEKIFINNVDGVEYSKQSDYFNKEDFVTVFYDFCKSLNLEDLFDDIIKNKKIFKMIKGVGANDYIGLNLHNFMTGESRILIDSFDYNLDSMFTLVHEFGHYYDLMEFTGRDKIKEYASYTFKSLYGEVIPRLFEKIFLKFLIKNNIMQEKAIDKLMDVEIINHDFILNSYILSLLESKFLSKDNYMKLDNLEFAEMVSKYFENSDTIFNYLKNVKVDLRLDVTYTYGDIVSMFLKEEVLAEGLNGALIKKFNEIKCLEFNTDFFVNEELSPERYMAFYEKELQLIKK